MRKTITVNTLRRMKQQQEKIATLTCYDASFAALLANAGIDAILVGDTLGNVILGYDTTVPVTLDDMAYHIKAVARQCAPALLIGDLPFLSYSDPAQALASAKILMQAGAHMVKLEGGRQQAATIRHLTEQGIAVCAHIGLTPQSVHKIGGCRVQGRDEQATKLIEDALLLQDSGADLLVLECIPQQLAAIISERLTIPTIGIGAGPICDGQVLVLYDMLGISSGRDYKFVRNFLATTDGDITQAIKNYVQAVKSREFPTAEHSFD